MIALHERRSKLDLVGKHIHVDTGRWAEAVSGIGSNSDSYYEYLLKTYTAFGNQTMWAMFQTLYHVRHYGCRVLPSSARFACWRSLTWSRVAWVLLCRECASTRASVAAGTRM